MSSQRSYLNAVLRDPDPTSDILYILFRAAEGAHALLPACPECGPAEAHPLLHFGRTSVELYVDPDPHPGGYQYLLFESY